MPEIIPEELELFPDPVGCGHKIVRAEVNMLSLPFFLLTSREGHLHKETLYEVTEKSSSGELVHRIWRVTGSQHLGHPLPYDKRVFRAIEAIIDEQGYPVENPIAFTTYELLKKMGEDIGGRQYEMVRKSIDRIIATTIIAQNIFWRKKQNRWDGETFHVYERCLYQGQQRANGQIAEKNYLYVHHLYLESINARYVKPIDYEYYKSLKRPLAKRLYELLSYKFFGAFKNNSKTLVYHYSTLCQLLPMKVQPYLSLARRCLAPAHEELRKTGFLSEVTWRGWKIYYKAGQRALSEVQQLGAKSSSDSDFD